MTRTQRPSRSSQPAAALNAVTLLLILGILAAGPAAPKLDDAVSETARREIQRDLRHGRVKPRAIAQVVREFVGKLAPHASLSDKQVAVTWSQERVGTTPAPSESPFGPTLTLREALLNLPPPLL